MEKITTVGLDLAKSVFSLHGVDASGRTVLRKTERRDKLMELIAALPPCLIGIEACGGAHEWARQFQRHGHRVGIMVARFVAPHRKCSKNDDNDAEAICEVVAHPNMRFVPVKNPEQQAILSLHRVRQGYVEERTATINRIRGLLAEFGIVLAQRAAEVRRAAVVLAEQLPTLAREAISDLRAHLTHLDARIDRYARQRTAMNQQSAPARRIMAMPGVGPLTASAITANVASGRECSDGRQVAAWLGLVPRQHSTGGKTRLGRITKRGDAYLRTLLMLGARAVLQTAPTNPTGSRDGRWRCASAEATTAPSSPSPPRTRASSGHCLPKSAISSRSTDRPSNPLRFHRLRASTLLLNRSDRRADTPINLQTAVEAD